jgi:hypothetical protein
MDGVVGIVICILVLSRGRSWFEWYRCGVSVGRAPASKWGYDMCEAADREEVSHGM